MWSRTRSVTRLASSTRCRVFQLSNIVGIFLSAQSGYLNVQAPRGRGSLCMSHFCSYLVHMRCERFLSQNRNTRCVPIPKLHFLTPHSCKLGSVFEGPERTDDRFEAICDWRLAT